MIAPRPIALAFALRLTFAVTTAAHLGCGDTGQPRVLRPAVGVGTAAREVEVGDYRVTLSAARVGFGPAVFCASRAASEELCPSALAEVTQVATIDALSPSEQPVGFVEGFVGTARSARFGYGITWLNTETRPQPKAAAPDGHSAHLEGRATHRLTGASFEFVVEVDVAPTNRGTFAVSIANIDSTIDESIARLSINVDPNRWISQIDFAELASMGTASIRVASDGRAANAVAVGMSTLAPPVFTFAR